MAGRRDDRDGYVDRPVRRPQAVLVGTLAVGVGLAGLLLGGAKARDEGGPQSLRTTDKDRACSEPEKGEAELLTELSVEVLPDRVETSRTITVTAPSRWWETGALRNPSATESSRHYARQCLFGSPFAPDPLEFETSSERTSMMFVDKGFRLGSSSDECFGLLSTRLEYRRALVELHPACDLARPYLPVMNETLTTVRVTVSGARTQLSPPPDKENGDQYEWSWRGQSDIPTHLTVEIPLGFATYASTYIRQSDAVDAVSTGAGSIVVSPLALANGARHLVITLVLVVALVVIRGFSRATIGVLIVAVLLLIGVSMRWEPGTYARGYQFATAAVPAMSAGLAIVVVGPARRLLAALVVILALSLAIGASQPSGGDPGVQSAALVIGLIGMLLMSVALWAYWILLSSVTPTSKPFPWFLARTALSSVLVGSTVFALAWSAGHSFEQNANWALLYHFGDFLPFYLAAIFPLALAVWTFHALLDIWDRQRDRSAVFALALVWGLAAAPTDVLLWNVRIPVGVVLLAVLVTYIAGCRDRGEVLDETVSVDDLRNPVIAEALLNHGPAERATDWRANTRRMVELGAFVAVAPVAFFAWGALDSVPTDVADGHGAVFLADSLLTEVARWLATAAVFGMLYRSLPGRIGPMKALSLAGIWFATASLVELLSRWAGHDSERTWTFPALQVLLFLTVLSLAYDYTTVRSARGAWSDMQTIYGIERTRDFVAFAVPAALAVIAIAQQVANGTGLDFVRGVVENVPNLTALGR